MTISDMRYELERFMLVPNNTPDDMILGLHQCYKMATDERLPPEFRLTLEALFSIFENSNTQWDIKYQELNAALQRGSEFDGDEVGRWDEDNQI